MIGGMTGILKMKYHLDYQSAQFLQGLNLIGLRRHKYESQKIIGLDKAFKEIFASKNLLII